MGPYSSLGRDTGTSGGQGLGSPPPPRDANISTQGIDFGVNESLHQKYPWFIPSPAAGPQLCQLPHTTPGGWVTHPKGLVPPWLCLCPSLGSYHCPVGAGPLVWGSLLGPLTLTSPHFGCLAAAREQNMSPQLLQKFKELIPTMGLTKDMLAILPKLGECQEGTG